MKTGKVAGRARARKMTGRRSLKTHILALVIPVLLVLELVPATAFATAETEKPTATVSAAVTATPSATASASAEATAAPTATPTLAPPATPTASATATATPTPTETAAPSASATASAQPTATPSAAPTKSAGAALSAQAQKATALKQSDLSLTGRTENYSGNSYAASASTGTGLPITYRSNSGGAWTNNGTASPRFKDAGSYTVEATITGDGRNYTGTVTKTVVVKIEKRDLHVAVDAVNLYYGDPVPRYTFSYDGFVSGENEGNAAGFSAASASCPYKQGDAVGTYTITVSGGSAKNYAFYGGTALLHVWPAPMNDQSLKVTGETAVYDGQAHSVAVDTVAKTITYRYSTNGGTTWMNAGKKNPDFTDAGVYLVEVTATGDGKDTLDKLSKTAQVIINKKDLAVKVDDKQIVQGDPVPAFTFSYDGFVQGESEKKAADFKPGMASCDYAQGAPAKTYEIKISVGSARNYNLPPGTGTLTVTAKNPLKDSDLKLLGKSVEYNGAAYSVTATTATGLPIRFRYSADGGKTWKDAGTVNPKIVNAGNYIVEGSITGDGKNYSGTVTQTAILSIDKKDLKITVDSFHIRFGDPIPIYTWEYTGFIDGENESNADGFVRGVVTGEYRVGDRVREYEITVAAGLATNYYVPAGFGKVHVLPRHLEDADLSITGVTVSYDGEFHSATVKSTLLSLVKYRYSTNGGRTWTTSAQNPQFKEVGAYLVEASIPDDGNNLKGITKTATVTIKPAASPTPTPSPTATPKKELKQDDLSLSGLMESYDGKNHSASASTTTGLPIAFRYSTNGGTTWANSAANPQFKDAGVYTVEATITGDGKNYTGEVTKTAAVIIEKLDLYIVVDAVNIYYGDPIPAYPFTYGGFITGENENNAAGFVAAVASCPYKQGDEVGMYTITVSGGSALNYTVNTGIALLHVWPSPLGESALTVSGSQSVYDGKPHSISAEAADGLDITYRYSLDGGATWTDAGKKNPGFEDVGSYLVEASVSGDGKNRVDRISKTAEVVVTKKPLTINVEDMTIQEGDPKPEFVFSYGGFVPGDNEKKAAGFVPGIVNTDYIQGSPAGMYQITVFGGMAQNYTLPDGEGTLTVQAKKSKGLKDADLKLQGESVEYSGSDHYVVAETHTGLPIQFRYSADGGATWVDSGTVNPPFRNAGTYLVEGTITGDEEEYEGTVTKTVTLAIDKKDLKIRVDSFHIRYGDPIPVYTWEYIDFVDGENEDNAAGFVRGTVTGEYQQGDRVREYDIDVSAGSADNYYVPAGFGKVHVLPRHFTAADLPITGLTAEYDGQFHNASVNATQGADVHFRYSTDGGATWANNGLANPQFKNAGEYLVEASLVGDGENDMDTVVKTAAVTITKKPLSVTVDDYTVDFDDAPPVYTFAYSGFVAGESADNALDFVGGTVSGPYARGSAAGPYAIALTAGSAANYTVPEGMGTLTCMAGPESSPSPSPSSSPSEGPSESPSPSPSESPGENPGVSPSPVVGNTASPSVSPVVSPGPGASASPSASAQPSENAQPGVVAESEPPADNGATPAAQQANQTENVETVEAPATQAAIAAAAQDDGNPPSGNTPAEPVPPTIRVGDTQIPLYAPDAGGMWALLNLILVIAAAVVMAVLLVGYFRNRAGKSAGRGNNIRLVGVIPAAVALILFLVTENMSLPMAITDQWTVWMIALAAAEGVVAYFSLAGGARKEGGAQA